MVPKIHAKFRRRHSVPYAIEQLSGRQFRCRHCNTIFLTEKELDRHISSLSPFADKSPAKISTKSPKLSSSVEVRVLYTYDLLDTMKRPWLRLKKGDDYDGL
jgi:uncharacterized C2H2 Zn-finger protein